MKVIQVTGVSGSGKTTFIRSLIPLLSRYGPVGTVKHTGHHSMTLPKGKDTTVMFEAGAHVVAGIDQEKTLITVKSTSLVDALDFLSGQGVAIAVMEGYKERTLPKIIIGDLDAEGCILRDPAPEDVIPVLDRFPDHVSPGEILRELAAGCRERGKTCTLVSAAVPVPAGTGEDEISRMAEGLPALTGGLVEIRGVAGARAGIRHGSLFGGTDEILVAIAAETGEEAALALKSALARCRRILEKPNLPSP
jgi:molybdopterin synthase catalytic subunit